MNDEVVQSQLDDLIEQIKEKDKEIFQLQYTIKQMMTAVDEHITALKGIREEVEAVEEGREHNG